MQGCDPTFHRSSGSGRARAEDAIAWLGALVGLAMALMKMLPFVPGDFSRWEWLALGLWLLTGILIGRPRGPQLAIGENAVADSGKHS